MTDLEKFIDLYKSLGVELKVENENPKGDNDDEEGFLFLILGDYYSIDNEPNPKLMHGYGGFHSIIHFDANGKFIKQSFWE